MRSPSLLFVLNDLGIGGVQRITIDLANRLSEQGFSVSIAVLWDRPESERHQKQLLPAVSFTTIGFTKFWDVRGWYRLYKYIRRERFDIVFTQLFMADLFGRTAAFLARTRLIITEIQNLIPHLPARYVMTDRLLRSITDLCISTTPAVTEYARTVIGYPSEKLLEIPTNAVDEHRFGVPFDREGVRGSFGIPPDAKLILSVGRLIEQKGHVVLIEAAPLILEAEPSAYIAIAGDGDQMDTLRTMVHELGLEERILLLGTRSDIPELLRSADVFAFPSLYEGQGMVLFEAIFSNLPIVASRVGGIPDVIVNEETGLLVSGGDSKELAAAIVQVLQDPQLAGRLTQTAHERFGDRTMDATARTLAEVLKERLVRV